MKTTIKILFFGLLSMFVLLSIAIAKPKNQNLKTKFYNFDDLLINGEYKKPQILYIDDRQKVRFEKLLKLKKDFIKNLKKTEKDPSLR
jgi:hypothetical protein